MTRGDSDIYVAVCHAADSCCETHKKKKKKKKKN